MRGVYLPGRAPGGPARGARPRARAGPGGPRHAGVDDLRQRPAGDLPRAPGRGTRGLPGRHRRARAVRAGASPSARACARVRVGDRVVVYHISGCGQCDECRRGYQISCTSPRRQAYGWQRDGGHADLLLAQERDLLPLPDSLTFLDGACVACGFATAYEALCRVALVRPASRCWSPGSAPSGSRPACSPRRWARRGWWAPTRRPSAARWPASWARSTSRWSSDDELGDLLGDGAEVTVDCSGAGAAQLTALRHTRRHGRCALVGEGGTLTVDVSEVLIHRQLTVHGSWVAPDLADGRAARAPRALGPAPRARGHPPVPVWPRPRRPTRSADAGVGGKVGIVAE